MNHTVHWVDFCGCDGQSSEKQANIHIVAHAGDIEKLRGMKLSMMDGFNYKYADGILGAPGWDADGAPVE